MNTLNKYMEILNKKFTVKALNSELQEINDDSELSKTIISVDLVDLENELIVCCAKSEDNSLFPVHLSTKQIRFNTNDDSIDFVYIPIYREEESNVVQMDLYKFTEIGE